MRGISKEKSEKGIDFCLCLRYFKGVKSLRNKKVQHIKYRGGERKGKEMTKISKIITAAAALGVMGLAVLPAASYAAVNSILQVNITGDDSDDGGNNPTGYKWFVSDKDGGTTNMTTASAEGGSSGGFELIATKVPMATGMTVNNTYGFQAYYGNVNVDPTNTFDGILSQTTGGYSDQLTTPSLFFGKDLLVGSGATGAGAVTGASLPVALGTSKAGTLRVTVPSLVTDDGYALGAGPSNAGSGNAVGWFKYDNTLPVGNYQNTLTVTTIKNT